MKGSSIKNQKINEIMTYRQEQNNQQAQANVRRSNLLLKLKTRCFTLAAQREQINNFTGKKRPFKM